MVIIFAGLFYHYYRSSVPKDNITRFVNEQRTLIKLRGVVIVPPFKKTVFNPKSFATINEFGTEQKRTIFLIRLSEVLMSGKWETISGNIRVSVPEEHKPEHKHIETETAENIALNYPPEQKIKYGDKVEITGYLIFPGPPSNPAQYDYRKYLSRNEPEITAIMSIKSMANVKKVSEKHGNPVIALVYSLKNKLHNQIYSLTSDDVAPVISSLLLGERENVPDAVNENFVRTGTIHFLAISGLHIGILIVTIHLLLKLLTFKSKTIASIIIIFIIFYTILTGMKPPVLRAGTMVILYYGAILINRRWNSSCGISAAAMFILLKNPDELFNVSFQLSFIALIGILTLSPRIDSLLKRDAGLEEILINDLKWKVWVYLKTYVRQSVSVSLAAWLAVLPIVAFYFHIIVPISILLNIIIFPLVWIVLVSGFILLITGCVHLAIAFPFAWIASIFDKLILKTISVFAIDNISYFYTRGPDIYWIYIYYLIAFITIYHKDIKLKLSRLIIIYLVISAVYISCNVIHLKSDKLKMTCFNVAHGTAILIEFPDGKSMLYDAGTWSGYDIGKNVIAPYLWESRIRKIDVCVITHRHVDHLDGLPSILDRFKTKTILCNKMFSHSQAGSKLLESAASKGINISFIWSGMEINEFKDVKIRVLNPPDSSVDTSTLSVNDTSCVIKIEYAGSSILLCADVMDTGIDFLLSNHNDDLQSDVIIVPHHGGFANNTEELIKHVQPEYAILSCKKAFPSPLTVEAYKSYGTKIFQTNESGAITVVIDKNGVQVSGFIKD